MIRLIKFQTAEMDDDIQYGRFARYQRGLSAHRVPKGWRHKNFICEISSLVVIFRKIKIKNASMPKFSILPQISDEILSWFCSDDPIQILIKIGLVPNVKNQAIFRRICMESLEHNFDNIPLTICTNMVIFSKDTFLVLTSWMILTNSQISSQILIFLMLHFAILF